MSEPERRQICFFTPSTICCGGVALDYLSMLMSINEQRLLTSQLYRLSGIYILSFFFDHLNNDKLGTFHHPATVRFVLNDTADHHETF